jgi:hypothetical protein
MVGVDAAARDVQLLASPTTVDAEVRELAVDTAAGSVDAVLSQLGAFVGAKHAPTPVAGVYAGPQVPFDDLGDHETVPICVVGDRTGESLDRTRPTG